MAFDSQNFTRGARAALLWELEQAPNDWSDLTDSEMSDFQDETYDSFSPPGAVQQDTGEGYEPESGVSFNYTITNKTWTVSLNVKKDNLDDDKLGGFQKRIGLLGRRMANHLRKRLFDQMFAGESNASYDGTNFFADSHTDWTGDNSLTSVAAAADAVPTLAELEAEYNTIIATMLEYTDRYGEPIWQDDSDLVLICGPQLRTVCRQLLNNDLTTNGQTNIHKGTADLIVTPHNEDTSTTKHIIVAKKTAGMRPMIYQRRKAIETETEENVKGRSIFFGANARYEMGYGHPYAAVRHQFTT